MARRTTTTVQCQECDRVFEPTSAQRTFIRASRANRMPFVMLECQRCGRSTSYDLLPAGSTAGEAQPIHCPASRCAGLVSFVDHVKDERPFWGCGECGSIWYDESNLQAEISAIVARYQHRRSVYVKDASSWIPADPQQEPADYEANVARERKDTRTKFVRG